VKWKVFLGGEINHSNIHPKMNIILTKTKEGFKLVVHEPTFVFQGLLELLLVHNDHKNERQYLGKASHLQVWHMCH